MSCFARRYAPRNTTNVREELLFLRWWTPAQKPHHSWESPWRFWQRMSTVVRTVKEHTYSRQKTLRGIVRPKLATFPEQVYRLPPQRPGPSCQPGSVKLRRCAVPGGYQRGYEACQSTVIFFTLRGSWCKLVGNISQCLEQGKKVFIPRPCTTLLSGLVQISPFCTSIFPSLLYIKRTTGSLVCKSPLRALNDSYYEKYKCI